MKDTKRRYRVRFDRICVMLFAVSFFVYLFSSIVIKSYNISLANKIAHTNNEITVAKSEVDSLTMSVKDLTDYSTVVNTIDQTTMTVTNSTVITLGD